MTTRTITFDDEQWQVVPKELTGSMIDTINGHIDADSDAVALWRDALIDAPEPPAQQPTRDLLAEATEQFEALDRENHRMRRCVARLMARLTVWLDDDQFNEADGIMYPEFEPPAQQPTEPYVVRAHSYGGLTGINDYLMSNGSVVAMRPDEAAKCRPPAPAQQPAIEHADILRELLVGYGDDGFSAERAALAAGIAALEVTAQQQDEQLPPYSAWLHVLDEAMVARHLGVADPDDDYITAKRKLHTMFDWEIDVATDPAIGGDRMRKQQPMTDRDRKVWRAALTLANNICAQESDRHNGDDETDAAMAASYCEQRIRDWIEPTDGQLAEMLTEAGIGKGESDED